MLPDGSGGVSEGTYIKSLVTRWEPLAIDLNSTPSRLMSWGRHHSTIFPVIHKHTKQTIMSLPIVSTFTLATSPNSVFQPCTSRRSGTAGRHWLSYCNNLYNDLLHKKLVILVFFFCSGGILGYKHWQARSGMCFLWKGWLIKIRIIIMWADCESL